MENVWDIPKLLVFAEVARTGSFTRAAQKLNLSKSVVSTHVRGLEESLGVRLLERTTRRTTMTEAGRELFSHAMSIEETWIKCHETIQEVLAEPSGKLRITAPFYLADPLIVPTIQKLSKSFPRVIPIVHFSDQIKGLLEDGFDLSIRAGFLSDSSFVTQKIGHDFDIVVANPNRKKLLQIRRPADLIEEQWVVHSVMGNQIVLESKNEKTEFTVSETVDVNSSTPMKELVLADVGIAKVPWSSVSKELEAGSLIRLVPKWKGRTFGIYAVYPSKELLPGKVRQFVQLMKELNFGPPI